MFAEERQAHLTATARRVGRVNVASATAELGVAAETIRRDLAALERAGLVRRVRGGAIPPPRQLLEPAVNERLSSQTTEKRDIVAAALSEIGKARALFLDAGTTTALLAEALPTDYPRIVVTNGLTVAQIAAQNPAVTVHLVGGRVRGHTMACVDEWALRDLAGLHVDVAFVGTNGVSATRGLTSPDPAEAAVKRASIAVAGRVVVLADHTKLGVDRFARFGEIDDIDLLITDAGADAAEVNALRSAGLDVTVAPHAPVLTGTLPATRNGSTPQG